MIETLADLVSPLSETGFRALLRERKPMLQRGAGVGRYATLIDWDGVMQAIANPLYPASKLRLTQRGAPVSELFYRDGGKLKSQIVDRMIATGASVVAYGLEGHLANFTRLCASLAETLSEHVSAGAIATTGTGGALGIHHDSTDLVILQIEGEKRWIIFGESEVDTVPGMAPTLQEPRSPPLLDIVLRPGDFLFLPAGYPHRCENQSARSLHAGIFFGPLTVPRVLQLLMRDAMADSALRRPMRCDAADRPEMEAALKDLLLKRIQNMSLKDLIAAHTKAPI